ncbi:dienelactone hydrolase family protein [Pseudoalteromonas piscicida]|uniref:alpha/beta family hydrolase n=1 Tax=Pseudoalteromonas piscicida TaxID=43662 RepID=UPI001D0B7D53|nr:alpha/beta family hydrolase [Pseudoalteromonas piscicida]UDM62504.1 dienelactone hydrolase family protein [Pseudoalteromonas piscicida]
MSAVNIEWHYAENPVAQFIFAHGAGAGSDSDFMQQMAKLLASKGVQVGLFDFEYMQQAKQEGKKRPPERAPKLLAYFQQVLAAAELSLPLFIGGKSMGGRMASMLACETNVKVEGVLAFGYPFHPPGKPEKLRVDHFPELKCPLLILQGERDTFGNRTEVDAMCFPEQVMVKWLKDGDHSLKPRKVSGVSELESRANAAVIAANFIKERCHG